MVAKTNFYSCLDLKYQKFKIINIIAFGDIIFVNFIYVLLFGKENKEKKTFRKV